MAPSRQRTSVRHLLTMSTLRAALCSSALKTCHACSIHHCHTDASEEATVAIVGVTNTYLVMDYVAMTGDVVPTTLDAAIMHICSATFMTGSAGAARSGSVAGDACLTLVAARHQGVCTSLV